LHSQKWLLIGKAPRGQKPSIFWLSRPLPRVGTQLSSFPVPLRHG
jgi:hypothetical protein